MRGSRGARILLVEGKDDAAVARKLLRPDSGVRIEQFSSAQGKLGDAVRAVVEDSKRTGLRVLGILRDADEEPAARVQSTIDAIERAGLPAASQAGIFTDTEPSTGFFLLPDHERPGSIETLCKEAVLDEPEAECVSAYLDCVERRRGSNWSTANRRDKAFVYSYMAALVRPTDDTEVAAWRDAWDLTASVFQPLRLFLDRLTDLADP